MDYKKILGLGFLVVILGGWGVGRVKAQCAAGYYCPNNMSMQYSRIKDGGGQVGQCVGGGTETCGCYVEASSRAYCIENYEWVSGTCLLSGGSCLIDGGTINRGRCIGQDDNGDNIYDRCLRWNWYTSVGCCITEPTPTPVTSCTCNWVNSGTCGTTTNGCGYEQMIQTKSCNPAGCSSGINCVGNLACTWPAVIRVDKEVVGGGTPPLDTITYEESPGVNQQFVGPKNIIMADTSSGVTHNISVPLNASYDVGYTLCYNSDLCHAGAITSGNNATILEDSIRANGPSYANPYASMRWHYCPRLSAPTNLQPNLTACVPFGVTADTTLTWNAVAGASSYTVVLSDITGGLPGTVVSSTTAPSNSQLVTVTLGRKYLMSVTANNACGGASATITEDFDAVTKPTDSGGVTAVDIGGQIRLTWPNDTDPDAVFRIYRGAGNLIGTVSNTTNAYTDAWCGTSTYIVEAYAAGRQAVPAPGCQINQRSQISQCLGFNDSWWAASGGGNLVAAQGSLRSIIPTNVYNPRLMSNSEGVYPGLGIGTGFINPLDTATTVNSLGWKYTITTSWGGSGSNMLAERENSYDGMKERIWSRITPLEISPAIVNLDQANFETAYNTAPLLGSTGVRILHWWNGSDNNGTINMGPWDLSGKKAVIFVDGNVNLMGTGNTPVSNSITWSSVNPGFLAVIARGNVTVNPNVGTEGLTMDVDVRPWNVSAHLMGIYYAGGTFSTGTVGAGRDRILKIDGTVVGMDLVRLQRNNVGRYPVEFFNFQPSLVTQLSQVGLRRKVVQELMNP